MHKPGIIVPFRNRWDQVDPFCRTMWTYLGQRFGENWNIFIIEQDDAKAFNRGMLCNIGFKEAKKRRCDYVVFHDIDMLPVDVDYSYSEHPVHLASWKLPFDTYFGGMTLFPSDTFKEINGFSNMYWGWGFEDDDLRYRCVKNNVPFKQEVVTKYDFDGKSPIFNGEDAYIELPNKIKYIRSFEIDISVRMDKLPYDHEKESDIFPIMNIEGNDFSIAYTSFKRFVVQWFDKDNKFYQIYSNQTHSNTAQLKVIYDNNDNEIAFYIDRKFIGRKKLNNRLYNYKKADKIYLGTDNKFENFFKGAIDQFSVKDHNNATVYDFVHNKTEGYAWKDLSGYGNHGQFIKINVDNFKSVKNLDGYIPFRRKSKVKLQKHTDSGFIGGRWKDDLTRWNQLRYNNEVLNGVYDDVEDGLSTCEYVLQGKHKKYHPNIYHLNVGI